MRNIHLKTLVTGIVLAVLLTGCAVPGRFTREQYAQLDCDPFISDETEKSTVVTQLADRAASTTTDLSDEMAEDRFALVADEEFSDLQECDVCDTPPLRELQSQPEDALASFFEAPEKPAKSKTLMQAVARTEDDFSKFMDDRKNAVVHASAEFIDTVDATQKDIQETAEESGYWGFQDNGLVEAPQITRNNEAQEDGNPFFDDGVTTDPSVPVAGNESTPNVAPPTDVFGDSSRRADWPPGDFEFN